MTGERLRNIRGGHIKTERKAKESGESSFYEAFWTDSAYQLDFALDSAARDRFPAIRKVWGSLDPPRRILDFGCGNGALTQFMASHGFGETLTGIDVSRKAIADAADRFSRTGLDFRFVEAGDSLASLGHFDVVVASHVLEHLRDPAGTLKKLRPLAERFIIEVPLERCFVQDARSLRLEGRRDNRVGHCQFWSRHSFLRLLEGCGFRVVRHHQYASAPFSPYNHPWKRAAERLLLTLIGTRLYGLLMTTHFAVLAERSETNEGTSCAA